MSRKPYREAPAPAPPHPDVVEAESIMQKVLRRRRRALAACVGALALLLSAPFLFAGVRVVRERLDARAFREKHGLSAAQSRELDALLPAAATTLDAAEESFQRALAPEALAQLKPSTSACPRLLDEAPYDGHWLVPVGYELAPPRWSYTATTERGRRVCEPCRRGHALLTAASLGEPIDIKLLVARDVAAGASLQYAVVLVEAAHEKLRVTAAEGREKEPAAGWAYLYDFHAKEVSCMAKITPEYAMLVLPAPNELDSSRAEALEGAPRRVIMAKMRRVERP